MNKLNFDAWSDIEPLDEFLGALEEHCMVAGRADMDVINRAAESFSDWLHRVLDHCDD